LSVTEKERVPASSAALAGTRPFSVTLKTAGSRTVTVTAGPATKLQVLLPGEAAAPGTASGKTGTPSDQAVGGSFAVVVRAVDANWNLVTGATPTVAFTSSDPLATLPGNAALIAGTRTFSVTLATATSQIVTAADVIATLTAGSSAAVLVLGTTLSAPGSIPLGFGFPGQTVTSPAYPVSWLSTETGKHITATLTADASDGTGHTITAGEITLILSNGTTDTVVGPLSSAQTVAVIVGASGSQQIKLRVRVPSAVAGVYTAALRFDVVGP
jgi:hypothetical protein